MTKEIRMTNPEDRKDEHNRHSSFVILSSLGISTFVIQFHI